ncbi:DUF393 domain-containing protein [Synechococcus sp. CS-602]|uniref:DCC1-like thiol-disulfide oxidoreductase family protein n=2 Tax=Synechococcaceae TaxID=1890426 RepID=UPI0008FF3D61|nr:MULTISPECIES: DCC1-like thiol-disulfide oxidoreductase family protein [Synechococcaceae]MCT0202393.1 DUF393 domain-containing protein [Synechococcus sp. CS-603]MCT0203783.1 DUF393 domain-containing protein [Synechococcus sp. CS-602]MCT0246474.1 DUF393 domain-containing protein [Synechococcus sp. CS-601]APD48865.1 hypothetical protein BM449_12210 [Synechococcus sp. SynAce01]MCT4366276.1 DUF393 domain-containing protein [Candidatus Regnicoccus frigidus MAG-AL2]
MPAMAQPMQLVYDGGCPFCRSFAATSALRGELPGLEIVDGRADHQLREQLKQRGYDLAAGAVLIEGERCWHGSEAVSRLCQQMKPNPGVLQLLGLVFGDPGRSRRLYPLLLLARRLALGLKGLPLDPSAGQA